MGPYRHRVCELYAVDPACARSGRKMFGLDEEIVVVPILVGVGSDGMYIYRSNHSFFLHTIQSDLSHIIKLGFKIN